MAFCLMPTLADTFLKKLRSGEIDPEKLMDMTSEARRNFFSEFLGEENAKHTNALFESKLLLKDQQQGIINWAKQITGIKPEIKRDILSKVGRMEEVLQPKGMDMFLEDLAEQRLGFGVSANEAGKIVDLAKAVADAKAKMKDDSTFVNEDDRMAYGRARVAFGDYVSELKNEAMKPTWKDRVNNPVQTLSEGAGLAKSLKASLDNSAIFRQGWRSLLTHPVLWSKNAAQSFADIASTLKGKEVMNEVMADVLSRPNAINGLYAKEKLDIGNIEEQYPSSLPEKIPGLGRLYKASEVAYTGFVRRMRADIFDKYVEIAGGSSGDTTGIGKLVNSLTGRGNLGRLEPVAGVVNNVFFSPRSIKAHIDVLTAHKFGFDKDLGSFAKKRAAINLVKIVGATAAVLAIAKAVAPDSVELDPRSADFGKIKIGDTRFDMSGGMSSLTVLAARLITKESKSSTTGEITSYNSGKFGAPTMKDAVYNFFENKLSPAAGVVRDYLQGETFSGDKMTLANTAENLLVPLPITNYQELRDNPNAAPMLLALIADGLGISTNTYSYNVPSLDMSNPEQQKIVQEIQRLYKLQEKPSIQDVDKPTGELAKLKDQIGDDKYEEAKQFYLDEYVSRATARMENSTYADISADQKKSRLNKANEAAIKMTLKKFGYKKEKPTRSTAS